MKKRYLTPPEVRIGVVLQFESNFLNSNVNIGGSSGEDLDDPEPFDPFS
ncbi:MAG: hypothetical protein J6T02_03755 [Bacteroidales bacterium]|nr:hypothetical protein [Bacteroidales bacterium]